MTIQWRRSRAGHAVSALAVTAMLVVDAAAGMAAAAVAAAPASAAPMLARECSPVNQPASGTYSATSLAAPDAATFKAAALKVNNDARAEVGVEPLVWDDEVARGAQYWASMIARTGVNKHDPDTPNGEAITGGEGGAHWSVENLMGGWVGEKVWFTNVAFPAAVAACNDRGSGPGHYFGLVRRAAHRIGCGIGNKGTEFRVVVCRYDPGYAPDGEYAWPTTPKPWPARTADPGQTTWVEGARFDVAEFNAKMLAANQVHRAGLAWDGGLADAAQWDARIRMLAGNPWQRAPTSPPAAVGELVSVANHGGGNDITDYPDGPVMYRDFLGANAEARGKLTGSSWTRVGCGSVIKPEGDKRTRVVICRYS